MYHRTQRNKIIFIFHIFQLFTSFILYCQNIKLFNRIIFSPHFNMHLSLLNIYRTLKLFTSLQSKTRGNTYFYSRWRMLTPWSPFASTSLTQCVHPTVCSPLMSASLPQTSHINTSHTVAGETPKLLQSIGHHWQWNCQPQGK